MHNKEFQVQQGKFFDVRTEIFGISCIFLQYNYFCMYRFASVIWGLFNGTGRVHKLI